MFGLGSLVRLTKSLEAQFAKSAKLVLGGRNDPSIYETKGLPV
jgi:hypothetical protein